MNNRFITSFPFFSYLRTCIEVYSTAAKMKNVEFIELTSESLNDCIVPAFLTGTPPLVFPALLLLISLVIACYFLLKDRKKSKLAHTKAEKLKQQLIDQSLLYWHFISRLGNHLNQLMIEINDPARLFDQFSGLKWYNELIQFIYNDQESKPLIEKIEVKELTEKIIAKALQINKQRTTITWRLRPQSFSALFDSRSYELILLNVFNGILLEDVAKHAEIALELRPLEILTKRSDKVSPAIELSITVIYHLAPNYTNNELKDNKIEKSGLHLLLPLIDQALEHAGGKLSIQHPDDAQSTYLLVFPANELTPFKVKVKRSIEEEKHSDKFTSTENENQHQQIMIVSDSEDERSLLIKLLSPYFECVMPHNPEQTMALLKNEKLPRLIITTTTASDNQGQNLAVAIRQTRQTSHLPVLVFAEHADPELLSKSYLQGADGILLPPLNQQLLIAQISRTIKNRELSENSQPQELFMTDLLTNKLSRDELFIQQLKRLIKQHLDQPDFNVHELSLEMELSTTQLYRKIKNLTGKSPVELIRNTRLEHAHQMLNHKNYSIKEVCYHSGFNNLSYFVKCFREYYGVTPASFRDTAD